MKTPFLPTLVVWLHPVLSCSSQHAWSSQLLCSEPCVTIRGSSWPFLCPGTALPPVHMSTCCTHTMPSQHNIEQWFHGNCHLSPFTVDWVNRCEGKRRHCGPKEKSGKTRMKGDACWRRRKFWCKAWTAYIELTALYCSAGFPQDLQTCFITLPNIQMHILFSPKPAEELPLP